MREAKWNKKTDGGGCFVRDNIITLTMEQSHWPRLVRGRRSPRPFFSAPRDFLSLFFFLLKPSFVFQFFLFIIFFYGAFAPYSLLLYSFFSVETMVGGFQQTKGFSVRTKNMRAATKNCNILLQLIAGVSMVILIHPTKSSSSKGNHVFCTFRSKTKKTKKEEGKKSWAPVRISPRVFTVVDLATTRQLSCPLIMTMNAPERAENESVYHGSSLQWASPAVTERNQWNE